MKNKNKILKMIARARACWVFALPQPDFYRGIGISQSANMSNVPGPPLGCRHKTKKMLFKKVPKLKNAKKILKIIARVHACWVFALPQPGFYSSIGISQSPTMSNVPGQPSENCHKLKKCLFKKV